MRSMPCAEAIDYHDERLKQSRRLQNDDTILREFFPGTGELTFS